jgi:HEPN domain-containing protein
VKNNYYDIAYNDYQYLTATMHTDLYNSISVQIEQVVEKLLKSVMEAVCNPCDKQTLNGHNLRKIYLSITKEIEDFDLDTDALSSLKDLYFDAKYPGENFIEVTEDMCIKYTRLMYEVIRVVNKFRVESNLYTYKFEVKVYSGRSNYMESVFNTDALILKYIPKEELALFKSYIPKNIQINENNVRMLANMYLSLRK